MRKLIRLFEAVWKYGFSGLRFLWLQNQNQRKKLKGIVSIRFPGLRHPVNLRAGTSDFKLFKNIFIEREYDIEIPFPPATIIDGGANIGLAAILFANRYPDARIISVEPEGSNYEMLEKNTANYPNIKTVKGGIWRNSSYLNIKNPESGKWAFIIEETNAPGANSIKGFSIDDLIHEAGWASADVVKLDVEGSEKEIFENSTNSWLGNAKAIVIELHDWIKPKCSDAVFNATKHLNFRVSQKGENTVMIRDAF